MFFPLLSFSLLSLQHKSAMLRAVKSDKAIFADLPPLQNALKSSLFSIEEGGGMRAKRLRIEIDTAAMTLLLHPCILSTPEEDGQRLSFGWGGARVCPLLLLVVVCGYVENAVALELAWDWNLRVCVFVVEKSEITKSEQCRKVSS
eukprot:2456496-Ditylum_brightwellii.AAC.1